MCVRLCVRQCAYSAQNPIKSLTVDCFDSTAANHAEQARQHAGPDNERECASKMIPKIISLIRLPTKITWRPTRND